MVMNWDAERRMARDVRENREMIAESRNNVSDLSKSVVVSRSNEQETTKYEALAGDDGR